MKKRFKGFTLIECLVALAVLGVSSLLLVQAYTQLMKMTNLNHAVYTSIADQMADAEKGSTANAKELTIPITTEEYNNGQGRNLTIERVKRKSDGTFTTTGQKYVTNVSVYASNAYVNHEMQDADEQEKQGTDVRYIYFHR
ncbi:MAG: prepilin-type N-terminal cleavage/methylation domain-containing protein [Ruminococcus sp.]|nr:prepilin-type N-terminal cleavage/methylation domain-containing protein [Ruminococcus sp.]